MGKTVQAVKISGSHATQAPSCQAQQLVSMRRSTHNTPFICPILRIERAEEWPFGVGSLSRVAFYLLLGLGSWVGAALVERLMESAL